MTLAEIRRRPTLPGRFQPSTISVLRLNFCVRDGNRWIPQAIVTGNLLCKPLLLPPSLSPSVRQYNCLPTDSFLGLPLLGCAPGVLTLCVLRTLKTAQVGFLVAPDQGAPFIPDILFLTNLLRASLSGLWFRFALAFPIPYSLIPIPSFQDQALDRLVSPSCMCYHTSTDDLSTLSSSRGLTCS